VDVSELTISGLQAGTTYTLYSVASYDLPLWPTLQVDGENIPARDQGTTDSVEAEEEDDSASYISTLLILLVAFLLN
jgi:hypothetical protein